MKHIIRTNLIAVFSAAMLLVPLATLPNTASAQAVNNETKKTACEALGRPASECVGGGSGSGISSIIASVINVLSLAVGIAAVIMIIVGGLRYVTSAGDANGVSAAKNTILYAIIGLVIALLSQGLVRFVLNRTSTSTPPAAVTQPAREDGECGIRGGEVC